MIKAILFDMDGVLIDAKDWHYEALNRALDIFGLRISRDAHLTTFDGLPTREKLKMLSISRGLPTGLHEFLNALKQRYTHEMTHQLCRPQFNHQYALSKLKSEGYLMGVCSNSVRSSVEIMMELADLRKYLDVLFSNEDVAKGKPDPEMYLRAMARLSVEPHETLILEDNENGIAAARASGAHLMIVTEPDDVTYHAIKNRISNLGV